VPAYDHSFGDCLRVPVLVRSNATPVIMSGPKIKPVNMAEQDLITRSFRLQRTDAELLKSIAKAEGSNQWSVMNKALTEYCARHGYE
jgi:hypothetical protein